VARQHRVVVVEIEPELGDLGAAAAVAEPGLVLTAEIHVRG
jgi:hypothetical protein